MLNDGFNDFCTNKWERFFKKNNRHQIQYFNKLNNNIFERGVSTNKPPIIFLKDCISTDEKGNTINCSDAIMKQSVNLHLYVHGHSARSDKLRRAIDLAIKFNSKQSRKYKLTINYNLENNKYYFKFFPKDRMYKDELYLIHQSELLPCSYHPTSNKVSFNFNITKIIKKIINLFFLLFITHIGTKKIS